MSKKKRIIFTVITIAVILGVGVFWFGSQLWFRGEYGATKREDLEEKFLESFETRDYSAISEAEHGKVIVYLGETGGQGKYAIFLKPFFFDCWFRVDRQTMEAFNHPMLIDDPALGRIYLSLNDREIAKAVVTKDGEETVIEVDPEKPLVVITDYEIDQVTFFTENNQEISEEDFLNTAF